MTHHTDSLTDEQRAALAAGVAVVELVEHMIHQLEYVKAVHLAGLTRLATRIARDEGHPDHGELVHRAVEAEVAVATRTGQIAVANRMGHADHLLGHYPRVAAEFSAGRVSLRHTEVIAEAGRIIADPEVRAAYEAEVVPLALTLTAQQLRAHAQRLAELFAEQSIDERHREARERRGVRVVDLDDGMADLVATIGAAEAYAIKDRFSRIAHHTRAAESRATEHGTGPAAERDAPDLRTSQQIQADVLTEMLLTAGTHAGAGAGEGAGSEPGSGSGLGAITGRVQITVPVLTLVGRRGSDCGGGDGPDEDALHRNGPAELAGYGPIDTETARRIAGHVPAWERVLTHPISGVVLTVDRYRPGADLRRILGARDEHCRFPGCVRRLDHCDIDHTVPAARGGPTMLQNLSHLCRKHHTLKHFEFLRGSGWRPKQQADGVIEWRSPTGRAYVDTPTSTIRARATRDHGSSAGAPRTQTRRAPAAHAPGSRGFTSKRDHPSASHGAGTVRSARETGRVRFSPVMRR